MKNTAPTLTEAALRRDIAYLERALSKLDGASQLSAQAAHSRFLSQLRRRRKQLRAVLAQDFGNWPRYSDAPLESAAA
jgi:hypothetical protein